jgi:hypothetical protein
LFEWFGWVYGREGGRERRERGNGEGEIRWEGDRESE